MSACDVFGIRRARKREQYKLQLIREVREKIQRKESGSDGDDPERYYMGNQD